MLDKATGNTIPKDKPSTFFPDDWNRLKVSDEIRSAYQNALANNKIQSENGKWVGMSNSGYKIAGYFNNGTVNTAYPLLR